MDRSPRKCSPLSLSLACFLRSKLFNPHVLCFPWAQASPFSVGRFGAHFPLLRPPLMEQRIRCKRYLRNAAGPNPRTALARSQVHKTALTCTQTHAVPGQTCLWMPQAPPQRTHTQQARPLHKPCQKMSLTQPCWICLPTLAFSAQSLLSQEVSDDSDLDSAVEQDDLEVWFAQNGPWGKVHLAKPDTAAPKTACGARLCLAALWVKSFSDASAEPAASKRDRDRPRRPIQPACQSFYKLAPQVRRYRSSPQSPMPLQAAYLTHALWSTASLSGSSAYSFVRYGGGASGALSRPVGDCNVHETMRLALQQQELLTVEDFAYAFPTRSHLDSLFSNLDAEAKKCHHRRSLLSSLCASAQSP